MLRDLPVQRLDSAAQASLASDAAAATVPTGGSNTPAAFVPDLNQVVAEAENHAARNAAPASDLGKPTAGSDASGLILSTPSPLQQSGTTPLVASTTVNALAPAVMRTLVDSGAAAIIVFFSLLLVALWFALIFVASRRGWARFASAHYLRPAPAGRRYRATDARFGGVLASYRNVVRVTFSRNGLYFSAPWTFRAFHRPFLIPWSSVTAVRRRNATYRPRYRIEIEDAAGKIFLRLSGDVAAELRANQAKLGKSASGAVNEV